jgi:DNA-directed RNA polymerase specialized sigma24 family protein
MEEYMATNKNETNPDTTLLLLRAILLVLLDSRNEADVATKPEVLLFRAGLSYKDISDLLGKKEDAVRKAVSRGK